jgi:predicted aldo/keto reductase-like oxidoreductase
MEYRKLPHGNERISIIGVGMGSIHVSSEADIERTIRYAMDRGINYFDFVPSQAKPFSAYAKAFAGRREQVYLQVHLGADYSSGSYAWTRDLSVIKREFEARLSVLSTDYADFGFIHCMDEQADFDSAMNDGLWEYALKLKQQGRIRHLGFSSHNPAIAQKFIDTGEIDMCMLAINPLFDYSQGSYGIGTNKERMDLYRTCECLGVGISVMKPFAGGQLLDVQRSPFHTALTEVQCMAYALDRPGVCTVLPGVRGMSDLKVCLDYVDATNEERDYSSIGSFIPADAVGNCTYCNHCQPCPVGLDVGMINKYYDLARSGDALATSHYDKLSKHASDCIQCGHCDERCPFSVKQSTRMQEIARYFAQ